MPRRFQFSLGRLFWATAWLSLAASSASFMARYDYARSGSLIFVWMAMTVGSTGGAIGAMIATRPILGAFRGAGVGTLLVAIFLIFGLAPLATRHHFTLRAVMLLASAFAGGVCFERARRWRKQQKA